MNNRKRIDWSENPGVNVDDSVNADNGSSVTVIKKFVKEHTDFLLGLFMALAVIEGAALWTQWHHKEQQSDLAMSNLHDFETLTFAPLAAQVKSDHDLIQAYGLQNSLSNCKR